MYNAPIQVYGLTILEQSSVEQLVQRMVNWPGGPGKICSYVTTSTGTSAVVAFTQAVTGAGPYNIGYTEIVPGVFPLSVSGTWDFIAPEGPLSFEIRLTAGDAIRVEHLYLVQC